MIFDDRFTGSASSLGCFLTTFPAIVYVLMYSLFGESLVVTAGAGVLAYLPTRFIYRGYVDYLAGLSLDGPNIRRIFLYFSMQAFVVTVLLVRFSGPLLSPGGDIGALLIKIGFFLLLFVMPSLAISYSLKVNRGKKEN